MALSLSKLSGDEQRIICGQLCNVLEPRLAVYLSSVSKELRELTQALLQQLRADHEAAAALCVKLGLRDCTGLRMAWWAWWEEKHLSATDLATLGSLSGSMLLVRELRLAELTGTEGPDGVQRLAEGLGAGALPAVTCLQIAGMDMGNAGASALAAALGRGALPRLKLLFLGWAAIGDASLVALALALRQRHALKDLRLGHLHVGNAGASALAAALGRGALQRLELLRLGYTAIGDAGLVALAPALRRMPVLETLDLSSTPFGDGGLPALVAPPQPAGALPPTGGLKKLKELYLGGT